MLRSESEGLELVGIGLQDIVAVAIHRLENPGKVPVILIEVQTGSYVGEDAFVGYEDMHARQ